MKLDAVHNEDCLKGLAKVPAGSIDLAFADPPFNIGYDYDVYEDGKTAGDYLDWCRKWLGQLHRVLKPDGTFWLAIGDEFAAELKLIAQRELGFTCRSWVVWYYTFGVNCTKKFSRSHAHLFHFVKDAKNFTFNAEAVRVPSARQLVYGDGRANPAGRLPDDTWILRLTTPYLPSVRKICRPLLRRRRHLVLPARRRHVQTTGRLARLPDARAVAGPNYSRLQQRGRLVLDPFAGSGTTLAVAKKLGRRFLGFELSKQYAANVEKRLVAIRPGDALDGAPEPLVSTPSTAKGITLKGTPAKSAKRSTEENIEEIEQTTSIMTKFE